MIQVNPDGSVTAIYSDELRDVIDDLGRAELRRVSHVEPDENGEWVADMSPLAGPKLGPFRLRADALAAEVAWLEEHL